MHRAKSGTPASIHLYYRSSFNCFSKLLTWWHSFGRWPSASPTTRRTRSSGWPKAGGRPSAATSTASTSTTRCSSKNSSGETKTQVVFFSTSRGFFGTPDDSCHRVLTIRSHSPLIRFNSNSNWSSRSVSHVNTIYLGLIMLDFSDPLHQNRCVRLFSYKPLLQQGHLCHLAKPRFVPLPIGLP